MYYNIYLIAKRSSSSLSTSSATASSSSSKFVLRMHVVVVETSTIADVFCSCVIAFDFAVVIVVVVAAAAAPPAAYAVLLVVVPTVVVVVVLDECMFCPPVHPSVCLSFCFQLKNNRGRYSTVAQTSLRRSLVHVKLIIIL